jgi:DNA-binding MarR family transcriptional regulator
MARVEQESDDAVLLGILNAVEMDPGVTQRHVARELGVALGLVNSYVKRCVKKGLIKVSDAPAHRYAYYITPKGLTEKSRLTASYFAHSFAFFRRARAHCGDVYRTAIDRGQRRLIVVGTGDLADVARLVAIEHGIEAVATIQGITSQVAILEALKKHRPVAAAVVVALEDSRETYEAWVSVLGANCVYLPELLRQSAKSSPRMRHE